MRPRRVVPAIAIIACAATLGAGLTAVPAAQALPAAHALRGRTLTAGARELPSALASSPPPVTVTYPGGDAVFSTDDGGIATSAVSQYLTGLPKSLGLPAGASLSDLFQAAYKVMQNVPGAPSSSPPPTFTGGSMSVSGSTITVDVPAASVQASSNAATETPNSIITGLGGKCLHVGSTSNGTALDLQDCDGTQSQHFWMEPDGTIQILQKCLTVNGTGNTSPVVLSDCDGGSDQQWQLNGNGSGTITNPASGRCLDDPASKTDNGTALQIYDCNGGSNQHWSWGVTPPVPHWASSILSALIGGLAGMFAYVVCLSFFIPTGGVILPPVQSFCSFWYTFVWTLVFGLMGNWFQGIPITWDNVKFLLLAAFVAGALAAVGGYFGISMFEAFPLWMQKMAIRAATWIQQAALWILGKAGDAWTALANKISGFFNKTATNAPEQLPPVLETAGLDTPGASGPIISGLAGKCVDDYGGQGSDRDVVNLHDCNGFADAQTWTVFSGGEVGIQGRCLDVTGQGTANDTPVQLYQCNGGANQQWKQTGSTLVNPVSGLCLTVPLPDPPPNGTQLTIQYCDGSINQRFFLPGTATPSGLGPFHSDSALRVLPFGDSITYGVGSSDGSGYRCDLQGDLSGASDSFSFAGSLSSGICSQRANEGHSGWTIENLQSIERCTITGYEPNVVLLDAGTNDVNVVTGGVAGGDPTHAAQALEALVTSIRNDDPGVVVVVGGLIPTPNATTAANMTSFNGQVSAWITQQQGAGWHVVWADMAAVQASDLADGLHPSDAGYVKMANAWNIGIDEAVASRWIQSPANPTGALCSNGGSGSPPAAPAAPTWSAQGTIAPGIQGSGWTGAAGQQIQFADITGAGRADYLFVRPDTSVLGWYNAGSAPSGGYDWVSMGTAAAGAEGWGYAGVVGQQIQFADMTGSGRADYLWVKPDSSVLMWYNGGLGANGDPVWIAQGQISGGIQGSGWVNPATSGQIQFADLNGDGKADYLWVRPDSSVLMWQNPGMNTGTPNGAVPWIWKGEVAVGVQASGWTDAPGQYIQFADLTGSGRADYLFIKPDSSVQAWYNPGLTSSGINWAAMGTIAPGIQASGWTPGNGSIQFADMTGAKVADYLWVQPSSAVLMWQNSYAGPAPPAPKAPNGGTTPPAPIWSAQGTIAPGVQASGWTHAAGQQIQFADITGRGRADYLFVRPDSSVLGWYNAGQLSGAAYTWSSMGLVASGIQGSGWVNPSTSGQIQFAEMTGSGRADYLWVKPDSSVLMWYNSGLGANGDPVWIAQGQIAGGIQGSGWVNPATSGQIQFADMTGSGRADYLWVRPDSSVLMWKNPGINPVTPNSTVSWIPEGEIAVGVQASGWTDALGQYIQFADLTGSGRADYLFIKPDSSVQAWYNPGLTSGGINWQPMGVIAPGVQASGWVNQSSGWIEFADMNGGGAADYLWVDLNSAVHMWQNSY